jgi:Na+/H+ antiporter NhaD/arsenite permease-like protein
MGRFLFHHHGERLVLGDAREPAETLAAISMSAVYMGAITYIGNAPNFMIYAIAVERGIKMPSFFGYLLWAAVVLLPVFGALTFVLLARGT